MTPAPVVAVLATAVLAGWAALAASDDGGALAPMLTVLVLALVAFLAGLFLQRYATALALGIAVIVLLAALESSNAFSTRPLAGPTNYANANAALYVQTAALAGLAAARCRQPPLRIALVAVAVVAAGLPLLIGSAAAAVGGVVVAAATLLGVVRPARSTRLACVAGALTVTFACAGSVIVAERFGNGVPDDDRLTGVAAALSERRIELWRDAGRLAADHPVTGVGPGRFDQTSPVARFDSDTRAAHSAPLEVAAETGLPGGAMLFVIVLAVLAGLWTRGPAAAPALVAVAAWSAFWLHADVDYVADFPAVVTIAALVAGLGTPTGGPQGPNG